MRAYEEGEYRQSMEWFSEQAGKRDKDFARYACNCGSLALALGEYDLAWKSFYEASCVMNDYLEGQARGLASLIGPQAARVFKGENYEKAMANCYLGIIDYMRGDYEKARIGFDRALESKMDAPEPHRRDFALAHYLKARALARGQSPNPDEVRVAYQLAGQYAPHNKFIDPAVDQERNLIVVVDMGLAPRKEPVGLWGSNVDFLPAGYPERTARVLIDGRPVGTAGLMLDFEHQAASIGKAPTDTIQTAKGVVKTGAVIGSFFVRDSLGRLIAIILSLLIPAQADIRQWDLLPGETHVFCAKLSPGSHRVEVRFPGSRRPSQAVTNLRVDKDDVLLYFRSNIVPDKATGSTPPAVRQPEPNRTAKTRSE